MQIKKQFNDVRPKLRLRYWYPPAASHNHAMPFTQVLALARCFQPDGLCQ